MILLTEQSSGHADAATDVKFFGYTYEVGTIGPQLGEGAYNVHYDNGYVEQVAEAADCRGLARRLRPHVQRESHSQLVATTTAVAQFTGNVTGSFRDSLVYGGTRLQLRLQSYLHGQYGRFCGQHILPSRRPPDARPRPLHSLAQL